MLINTLTILLRMGRWPHCTSHNSPRSETCRADCCVDRRKAEWGPFPLLAWIQNDRVSMLMESNRTLEALIWAFRELPVSWALSSSTVLLSKEGRKSPLGRRLGTQAARASCMEPVSSSVHVSIAASLCSAIHTYTNTYVCMCVCPHICNVTFHVRVINEKNLN